MPESHLDHGGLLALAGKLGADVVQFADNLPLDTLTPAALDRVLADADTRGLAVELGTRGIGRAALVRCAGIAARAGAGFVRTILEDGGAHVGIERAIAVLRDVEPEFRDRGVRLAFENHDRYTTAELVRIVKELGSWTGVCLDTVNSFGALEGPDAVIAALAPYAINLHVKDFAIERAWHRMGFGINGTAVGRGRLDVPALLDRVRGSVSSAVIELWTPPAGDLAATIARERAWAEESVEYLRRYC
jgi:3-oxoisoapionate decarboxylase